jgi:hypothetical protein
MFEGPSRYRGGNREYPVPAERQSANSLCQETPVNDQAIVTQEGMETLWSNSYESFSINVHTDVSACWR